MSAFSERTPKQEKEFNKWVRNAGVPFTCVDPDFRKNWPKFDVEKLFDLFLLEQERRKEGWYASFNDVYDDIMLEFAGLPPKIRDFASEFTKAQKLLFTDCRTGVSKIMILARKGYFHAQLYAAEIFYEGGFLPQNYNAAWKYLEQSIACGSEESFSLAALMYFRGCGRKKNRERAVEMFQAAVASQKVGNLQYLGLIYALGELVDKDEKTAEKMLLTAVDSGFLQAGIIFFLLCDQGILSDPGKDPFEVLHGLADRGYPPAEYTLALFLFRMVITDTGLDEARYQKLLEQASIYLGRCCSKSYHAAEDLLSQKEALQRGDGVLFTISECLETYYKMPLQQKMENTDTYS